MIASLFGFPALVAGLVLLLVGGSWFTGATTVGIILLVTSGLGLLMALVVLVIAAIAISKDPTQLRRRF